MEKDIYLADRKGGKVKLYDHRTQTQPYSHDQKNSKQILKLMKQYKGVGYGEELKEQSRNHTSLMDGFFKLKIKKVIIKTQLRFYYHLSCILDGWSGV